MIVCLVVGHVKVNIGPRTFGLFACAIAILLIALLTKDGGTAKNNFLMFLPAIYLYILDKKHQEDLVYSVTKWTSIMLGISILLYIGSFVGLPPFGTFKVPDNDFYTPYANYFFYIKNDMYGGNLMGARFNGPFLEPGHLAIICVMLLYANRYRMKENKYLWILVASALLSLSLAGYILIALGIMFVKMRNFRNAIIIASVVGLAYFGVTYIWNEGDNVVNNLILSRLEMDDKKGIKGNNRTNRATDKMFSWYVDSGKVWTGMGNKKVNSDKMYGAGYKIFLLRNSLLFLLAIAAFYILLINPKANKRYAWSFLILIALCFIQRGYPAWFSWLLPYTAGIGMTRGEAIYSFKPKIKKRKKKGKKRRIATPIPIANQEETSTALSAL